MASPRDAALPGSASDGVVWATGQHPGQSNETARTWTAADATTVNIKSHVAMYDPNPTGNGVEVRILKNTTTIWGPVSLAKDDVMGVEANIANVSLAAGDVIRFVTNNKGDWAYDSVIWNPVVAPTPVTVIPTGFSSTNGANGWRYQDWGITWQDIALYNPSGVWGVPEWHDSNGGYVGPFWMHPGSVTQTARTWTAPQDGVVSITGHAAKLSVAGNGVMLRVTKNTNQILWGPTTIGGTDQRGVDVNVAPASVSQGDEIRFEIFNNGDWSYDSTAWYLTITYQGGSIASDALK